MFVRVHSQLVRSSVSRLLRTATFSSSSATSLASDTRVPKPISAQARQRERRQRERAEQETALGIEGTVQFHTRQLVVVDSASSAPLNWPKKIELSDHIVATYVKAIATVEPLQGAPLTTIAATPFPATCADGEAQSEEATIANRKHDLLIFPDHIRVNDVDIEYVSSLVTQLLQPDPNVTGILSSLELDFKKLEGHHILVCAHEARDERCGCNGPKLLRWLLDVGARKNVPLHLYSSSHFGGHRYAANCIAYPSGDWFGLLNEPKDADALVDALVNQQPLRLLTQWRGRIATKKEDQIKIVKEAAAAALNA